MTREEIENIPKNINTLLGLSVPMHTRQKLDEKLNKVCELAIKALEQEPCEDCISRKYLLSIASEDEAYGYVSAYDIANAPSVNPQEPKTGHWIVVPGMNEQCSECGKFFPLSYFKDRPFEINYCPNCGSYNRGQMDE